MTTKYSDTRRRALFAGSFRPFTIGHADIVDRGLQIFDSIVICVGINFDKPHTVDTANIDRIRQIYADNPRVEVITHSGLTIDAARANNCTTLLRSARTSADFVYEQQLADINRHLAGIDTVILTARPELSFISSSMVRELIAHGKDVSCYLP